MIPYKNYVLSNGLKVVIHEDHSVPLVAVNILYNVGSKDENPGKTGFAHLFEHLMFGGSVNIPSYDEPLQRVGGENNAFTSPDITNYYIQVPAINIETAFWLESDRMLGLPLNQKVLDVQKKVVTEEFKQRYLNQPYGDIWLKIRPLAYQKHPYRWATIGKDISHIENASLEDVKSFYKKFYHPANAVMAVSGDISYAECKRLTEKWFGEIERNDTNIRKLMPEPDQTSGRFLELTADVPLDALYKVYHMPGRLEKDFYPSDFLSDILGRGKSSRLFLKLVKEKKIFNSLNAYITGSDDPGLLVISGKVNEEYNLRQADTALKELIIEFTSRGPSEMELKKIKNQAEAAYALAEVEILNKAMNLAYFYNLGDPELYNLELEKIQKVEADEILNAARQILRQDNCSTLYYHAEKKHAAGK